MKINNVDLSDKYYCDCNNTNYIIIVPNDYL